MSTTIENTHGTICPGCREPLDPQDRNEWDEHLQGIFCRVCINEFYYWLAAYEEPEQRLIDLVEQLSGKPYWEYQIAILEQNESLDDEERSILRNAKAKKKRSNFRIIK
jgi:hypothetical protein